MSAEVSSEWPDWWEWDLEFTPYLRRRMEDRDFNEVELRSMLERASGYREDVLPGRWVIETRLVSGDWEVIVEPHPREETLVVITAYPLYA